jgi:hypothetical protein
MAKIDPLIDPAGQSFWPLKVGDFQPFHFDPGWVIFSDR